LFLQTKRSNNLVEKRFFKKLFFMKKMG